jgi:hypothetical protein
MQNVRKAGAHEELQRAKRTLEGAHSLQGIVKWNKEQVTYEVKQGRAEN